MAGRRSPWRCGFFDRSPFIFNQPGVTSSTSTNARTMNIFYALHHYARACRASQPGWSTCLAIAAVQLFHRQHRPDLLPQPQSWGRGGASSSCESSTASDIICRPPFHRLSRNSTTVMPRGLSGNVILEINRAPDGQPCISTIDKSRRSARFAHRRESPYLHRRPQPNSGRPVRTTSTPSARLRQGVSGPTTCSPWRANRAVPFSTRWRPTTPAAIHPGTLRTVTVLLYANKNGIELCRARPSTRCLLNGHPR